MVALLRTRRTAVDPIDQLEADVKVAATNPARFPRTSKLLAAGVPQQAKKMAEEATELAIEAVRNDKGAALQEAADLIYNLAVLLGGMQLSFEDIRQELDRRRRAYGIATKHPKALTDPVSSK